MAAPKLPEHVAKLFDNTLFKLLIFFLIAMVAKKSPHVAIVAAIAVLVTFQTLNTYKMNREMMAVIGEETQDTKAPGCKCECSGHKMYLSDKDQEAVMMYKGMMSRGKQLITDGQIEEGTQLLSEAKQLIMNMRKSRRMALSETDKHRPVLSLSDLKHKMQEGNRMMAEGKEKLKHGNVEEGRQLLNEGNQLVKEVIDVVEETTHPVEETPLQHTVGEQSELLSYSGESMEDKVSKVVTEAKKIEAITGRNISNEELKELCSRASGEHSLRMESLSELSEVHPVKGENTQVPDAFITGTNGSDYASV